MTAYRLPERAATIALLLGGAAFLVACQPVAPGISAGASTPAPAVLPVGEQDQRCAAFAGTVLSGSPVTGLSITTSRLEPAGTAVQTRDGPVSAPAHCLVEGRYAERQGIIGGPYHIAFRMRLPREWNGRFLFEGGGGSNGIVREALGLNGKSNVPALLRGYAVIAQDSGHDNDTNKDPAHGGNLVFGHDPEARRNYGHASLKQSYDLGRYLIRAFYGRESDTNLFWGCSKGGQEGMAFAQRYPDAFDGIVAMAPGFSLPRAAVAQAWDTQQFASLVRAKGQDITIASLKQVIAPARLQLVSQVLAATCDPLDGTTDGMINAIGQCTSRRVLPELRKHQCAKGSDPAAKCLDAREILVLAKVMAGPRDSAGKALYSDWAWDTGLGAPGWQVWKTGLVNGPPALNVVLGGGSLAAVFTSPPTSLPDDPEKLLGWQLAFNFDRDAAKIYAVAAPYSTSAWSDVGMRSTDLSAFKAGGGKLIVPHGMSDPVFSALDTINWWNEVDAREHGDAASFVRVFPVPGMNHCGSGPATDSFDSLGALENWVIDHRPPAFILAKAGPDTPWPGRERPLCPYPQFAVAEKNGSFQCGTPGSK